MSEFSFWNNWARPYKALWFVLLALFAGSILCFIGSMWVGATLVIDWQNIATLDPIKLPLARLEHPLMNIDLEADSYVVKENFLGSALQVNLWPAYILLAVVSLGLSIALAVISSLSRFWYIAGMAVFCGLIVTLRLEQLQLFGRIDKTADALVFLLILPISYYFHAIRPVAGITGRTLTFLFLFVLLGSTFHAFAEVGTPFLYIANYGLPAFIGLSVLLIILVSPEIIAGILYLVTASNTEYSRNSLTHFLLASLIYLGNLLLYYLEVRNVVDWGLYTISPFYILLISLLVGIWTLRKRSENFRNILLYEPAGALLYLALVLICLSTVSYVFVTANDPFIETFEDAILYTHLGFGGLFLLYILANFLDLLKENKRVYQVLYNPRVMPLFTARLTGLIAALGLYSLHGMYAIYQPAGGYFNAIGDLYSEEKQYYLAEQYYKLGSQYKYGNHRSNYALASLAVRADKPALAIGFLKEALERQPTPFAYANLANLYFGNNLFFDGLFTLREGIKRYPGEGRLYNNLGVQYGKTAVLDSALYYLEVAGKDADAAAAAAVNELAVLAEKQVPLLSDSLEKEVENEGLFYQNNLLALYQATGVKGRAPERPHPAALRELGGVEAAYLLNYALLKEEPDPLVSRQLRQLIDSAAVLYYEEPAALALATLAYKQPDYFTAYQQLADLASRSTFNSERYFALLGGWSLEQRAARLATDYLREAASRRRPGMSLFTALTLAESGQPMEAAEELLKLPDSLLSSQQKQLKAEALLLLSRQDFREYRGNRNRAAYLALRMQWGSLTAEEETRLLGTVEDAGWKARALIWLAGIRLRQNKLEEAAAYLQEMQPYARQSGNELLLQEYLQLRHRLQLYSGEWPIPEEEVFPGEPGSWYRQAMQHVQERDTLASLPYFRQIFAATPFLEPAYYAGIPLFNQQGKQAEAYDFLLKAIHFNPYSVQLKKQYIFQSLQMGLEQYAEDELLRLMELLNQEDFNTFVQEYETVRQQLSERDLSW